MSPIWTCPTCHREFARPTKSHWCTDVTVDDLFAKSADDVVLAFDAVLVATADWAPNYIGAAKRAVVFSRDKAWMIGRPARRWLDLTLFFPAKRRASFYHKVEPNYSGATFRHTIRLRSPADLTEPVLKAIQEGWQAAA